MIVTSLAGGAGGAAAKLKLGLSAADVEMPVLVMTGTSRGNGLLQASVPFSTRVMRKIAWKIGLGPIEKWPLRRYTDRPDTAFSVEWMPDTVPTVVERVDPDIVNIHFLAGVARIETLPKFRRPIVWTLCDSWSFTGGCYLPHDCDRFASRCGCCPQLNSRRENDLSRRTWERKSKAWGQLDLTIASPSRWLAERARSSSLFGHRRIEVIPAGVDTGRFRPTDRLSVRRALSLPEDRRLILFGAWHNVSNKGFHFLTAALERLAREGWGKRLALAVFGFPRPPDFADPGVPTHFLGPLNDDLSKALLYSTADVFLAPSMEDNFPNTVLEATACGTPTVAFRIGGMPDLIDHEVTGYLARPFEVDDLARGMAWILEDETRHERLSRDARAKAEREFTIELYGQRYKKLFEEILGRRAAEGAKRGDSTE